MASVAVHCPRCQSVQVYHHRVGSLTAAACHGLKLPL